MKLKRYLQASMNSHEVTDFVPSIRYDGPLCDDDVMMRLGNYRAPPSTFDVACYGRILKHVPYCVAER